MKTPDRDLAMQMLQALDDPAAVIMLSIMRYRGMPPELAAFEQPVLGFISEHFKAVTSGTWPVKALEIYRASAVNDERITDAHFQHLFDWACIDWPQLSPLALAIWVAQNHEIPWENIDQAIKLLFPGATEQQLLSARSEVAQAWKDQLAD